MKLTMLAAALAMLSTPAFGSGVSGAGARGATPAKHVQRQVSRTFVLAPGEYGSVASLCLAGETVVSGGPSGLPSNVTMTYSNFFREGNRSGWVVEFRNPGNKNVRVTEATALAMCSASTPTAG